MHTQNLVSVLNKVSDYLHRSWFKSLIRIQENSAYTGVGFSLKSRFTKVLITPVFLYRMSKVVQHVFVVLHSGAKDKHLIMMCSAMGYYPNQETLPVQHQNEKNILGSKQQKKVYALFLNDF